MKLLALTIGNQFTPSFPSQINYINSLSLQRLLSFGINLLLTIVILLALFFLIFGGIKWLISQGDKKQVETAQKTITYAIIGLVIVLLSFFIINLIGYAFQVPLLGN